MNERYYNKLVRVRDLLPRDTVNGGAFFGMPPWPLVVKEVLGEEQPRHNTIVFADGTRRSVHSDTLVQIHRR